MLRVLDLFAGCGGLSLGLRQAGLRVNWANEIDRDAARTYASCHPETALHHGEAQHYLRLILDREKNTPQPGDVDLVVGGPPCQGFSGYNRFRTVDDPRNSLIEVYLDFVSVLKPQYFLIENVPGMLSLDDGKVIHGVLSAIGELGYSHSLGILQAGYYGIPQNRWRVFIWAARVGSLPPFPEPTTRFPRTTIFGATKFRSAVVKPVGGDGSLFAPLRDTVTVRDAIGDLPAIVNGGGGDEVPYTSPTASEYQRSLRNGQHMAFDHRTTRLGPLMFQRCQAVPKRPGAGWLDLPDHLKPKNLVRHGDRRYDNRFGRLHWGGTFNTILSAAYPYWGAVFHPEQDRVISIRESARAQGFPDSVKVHGSMSSRYRQVGNAVPPPLAQAIGEELVRLLN